jgi:hypothetical protein
MSHFSDFALRLDTKLPTNATNLAIYRHYATASNHLRYVLIPRPYPKKILTNASNVTQKRGFDS